MIIDAFPPTATHGSCRNSEVDGCISRSTQQAIYRLLTAANYAQDAGRNCWDFAVTIGELRRDGVTENELRWLVCRGHIEHAQEVTSPGLERGFDHHVSLRFNRRSAFVITPAGVAFGRDFLVGFSQWEANPAGAATLIEAPKQRPKLQPVAVAPHASNGNGQVRPKWDRDRRELRLNGKLIKVFKLPSPMQEAILMALEEEHWPPRIDDPLPGHPNHLPKRRLHDTIKSLNRNQKNSLIRFMGDGTGEGIRWELIPVTDDAVRMNGASH